jgi:hypothetical protein
MSLRKWKEVQKMSRSLIALTVIYLTINLGAEVLPAQLGSFRKTGSTAAQPAADPAVSKEFGFVWSEAAAYRGPGAKGIVTAYQFQDATGALAAWDWMRPSDAHRCDLDEHCAVSSSVTLINDANYVLRFEGLTPKKPDFQALVASLPKRHPSDLPPVVSFVPLKDLVPNSSRYILGPESLRAVAPELVNARPGFDQGAEAHFTAYRVGGNPVKLVLFDYPSPEMARLHTVDFKLVSGTQVKRSGVLVAVILPGASEAQGNAVLDQIKYQAKILWNEPPPPNPVPKLYSLLMNIIIASAILVALCLAAGLIYGMMRLYRRRYGTLEEDESMTTLHLTGE